MPKQNLHEGDPIGDAYIVKCTIPFESKAAQRQRQRVNLNVENTASHQNRIDIRNAEHTYRELETPDPYRQQHSSVLYPSLQALDEYLELQDRQPENQLQNSTYVYLENHQRPSYHLQNNTPVLYEPRNSPTSYQPQNITTPYEHGNISNTYQTQNVTTAVEHENLSAVYQQQNELTAYILPDQANSSTHSTFRDSMRGYDVDRRDTPEGNVQRGYECRVTVPDRTKMKRKPEKSLKKRQSSCVVA